MTLHGWQIFCLFYDDLKQMNYVVWIFITRPMEFMFYWCQHCVNYCYDKILNSAWMLNCWSSTINCRSSNFTIILKGSLLTESHLWWNFRLYIKLWIHKIFWKWMLTRGKCNLTLFSPSQTYWLFYFNSSGILSKDYRNHFPIY